MGGAFEGALDWKHQAALAVGLFALTVVFGIFIYRSPGIAVRSPGVWISIPLVAILSEKAVRAATQQSWQARGDLAESVLLALLFLAILNAPSIHETILWSLTAAAALWSVVGVYWSYQSGYRELALPLGNRALMAGLLVVALPAGLGLLGKYRNAWRGLGALLLTALIVGAIIRTRSAGAMLLLCASASVFVWFNVRRRLLFATVAVLLAAVALTIPPFSEFGPVKRVSALLAAGEDPTLSWNNRVRYWDGALALWERNPVFGHGAGQAGVLYGYHRVQQAGLAPHGEVVADVHNLPLNWLIEYGVWGASIRLIAFGALMWTSVMVIRRTSGLQTAAAMSLFAYGVYSLAHYQLVNPAIVIALTALAAVATPTAARESFSRMGQGWPAGVVLCLGCAAFASQSRAIAANYLFDKGKQLAGRSGVAHMLRASTLDSASGVYDLAAALRIERLYLAQGTETDDASFLHDAAERHYLEAVEKHALIPPSLAAYGRFMQRTGRPCEAVSPLQRAVSLDFFHSYSHFDLANAFQQCGDERMARQEAAVALITNPSVVYASAWRAQPDFLRASLAQAVGWLSRWTHLADHQDLRSILEFLNGRLRSIESEQVVTVHLTLSDLVATELRDDPFAFIFQRKMFPFPASEILVDGLESGSWAPPGIGERLRLGPITYPEVLTAYEHRRLEEVICRIAACS